jgi:hypothetical protein
VAAEFKGPYFTEFKGKTRELLQMKITAGSQILTNPGTEMFRHSAGSGLTRTRLMQLGPYFKQGNCVS